MKTLMEYIKKPSTYVLLLIGAVVAFAFGSWLKPVKKVADSIPGSDAKTGRV